MQLKDFGPNLDRQTLDNIKANFNMLAVAQTDVLTDILKGNTEKVEPEKNGGLAPSSGPFNVTTDFGANFISKVNGVLYATKVYANISGKLGIGLSKQQAGQPATEQIAYKEVTLNKGWNHVLLNFPLRQGERYTLFKRNISGLGGEVYLRQEARSNWQSNPDQWIGNALQMMNARRLINGTNYGNLVFFEIEVVTNIAQAYHILNESTQSERFYVGSIPPVDAQFWFRPVGG